MTSDGGTTPENHSYSVTGADSYFNFMMPTSDGGYVLGGEIYANSSNPNYFDYGLIYKLNSGLASCGETGLSYDLTFQDAALTAGSETIPISDVLPGVSSATPDIVTLSGDSDFCSTGVCRYSYFHLMQVCKTMLLICNGKLPMK